jgi:hypothetical protein
VLFDNYDNNNNTVPPFFEIDNNGGTIPYYDVPFRANGTGYVDVPFRASPGEATVFDAMLFLVTGPAPANPGKFTIYGAVDWGWSNQPAPEPSSVLLLVSGIAYMMFRRIKVPRR